VFKAIGSQVDGDFLAMDILPILWQFSLGPLLNLGQFQAYMALIKSLSTRVENEQTRKLQELGANNAPTTSRNEFMSFGGLPGTNGIDGSNTGGEADFEALVRGTTSAGTGSDMLGGDPWANAPASASSSTILPSRPVVNRTVSGRNASPAATFSWSTPPVSPPATNLTAIQPQGRTITPDNALNSLNSTFPAMAPANPGIGSSFSQPQQRSTMGMSSMMSPTATAPSYSAQGTAIDWSKAAGSSSLGSNPWGGSTVTANTTSALSSFSATPQPIQTQMQQQGNPYSAFSIAPPPSKSANSFRIAPPPGSGSTFSIAPPPSIGARASSSSGGLGMSNLNSMTSRMGQPAGQKQQQTPNNGWGGGGDSLI